MNKMLLSLVIILLLTQTTGCNFELASDIDEDTARFEQDVEALIRLKSQLPAIEEEIAMLREKVAQKSRELKEFEENHPDVVEFVVQQNKD
ncbi:MAG: hypothetical protein ACD_39C01966G0001 [uncultured bacterium]|nr:MAG: hypothetical protein ACD_39C01966G0001 [uncultured bacterium]